MNFRTWDSLRKNISKFKDILIDLGKMFNFYYFNLHKLWDILLY